MALFDEIERAKIRFLDTCLALVEQGRLTQGEYQDIFDLLDRLEEFNNEEFKAELSRISKGLSDLLE